MVTAATHPIAVLASGEGSNFEALALAAHRGEIPARVTVLVTDRPESPALERARRLSIEALCLPAGRFRSRLEDESVWVEALQRRGVETVLLAGFMRRLHDLFLDAFPGRTLNIHPSLLPAFPGLEAIRRAWEHGVRVTGCTVHVVTSELDAGPILAQSAVEVRDDDTLASLTDRVHQAEHGLYPAAVRRFLTEPCTLEDGRLRFGAGREEVRHG